MITDIHGNVLSNNGFNASDVDFFQRFVITNAPGIIMESRGEI